jgi:hypothetical protein
VGGIGADLLRAIDERISSRRERVTAVGTVTSRSAVSTVNTLDVAMDGSSLALPVKQFAGVLARAGDRVGLVKFGSEWVVVGSFGRLAPESAGVALSATIGSTTSATYTPTPGAESFTFVKDWDDTKVRLRADVGCYASGAVNTAVFIGLHFAQLSTTYDVGYLMHSNLSIHNMVSGHHPGVSGIPAGTYTVGLQWKRTTGAGSLSQDMNDWISIGASEVGP